MKTLSSNLCSFQNACPRVMLLSDEARRRLQAGDSSARGKFACGERIAAAPVQHLHHVTAHHMTNSRAACAHGNTQRRQLSFFRCRYPPARQEYRVVPEGSSMRLHLLLRTLAGNNDINRDTVQQPPRTPAFQI